MNSVDASSPVGEKAEPEKVPVKHPRWCDRSRCTAPEFRPAEPVAGTNYYHRSANLAVLGDWAPLDPEGVFAFLHQAVAPWDCTVYLVVNDIHIALNWRSPLLWAVLDEHAEIGERFPGLLETGREDAARQARRAES